PKLQLCQVESANEALDRPDWIVRPYIVLNPRRKETGLIPAIADLECAIRHKPNRTPTLKTRHSCPASTGKSLSPCAQQRGRKAGRNSASALRPTAGEAKSADLHYSRATQTGSKSWITTEVECYGSCCTPR